MRRNKYLLLISSLGVLALLVVAAVQENFLREWRRIQATARTEEGPARVQLRQIVNPALRISDRCVSCHLGMAPTEQLLAAGGVLAPHQPVVHDPADFGCTTCHSGQGQATDKADAHGDVHFWPQPMIHPRFSYAGCGTCHAPLGVPHEERLEAAARAFERLDCLACHRLDGRGGTLRPGGGGMEGPDLSRAGLAGYDLAWYEKHLAAARAATSGPWTTFASIPEPDRPLLADFLSTRVAAPGWMEAKATFHSTGCLGCHKVSGVGGDDGPDLSLAGLKDPGQMAFANVPGERRVENWMAEHFRSPAAVVPGSQMPSLGLSERQIERLTFYVTSLRRRDLPGSFLPADRVRVERFGEREFAADGKTLFAAFCSGCHGPQGEGRRPPGMDPFPAIAHPDFLELVSDDFLRQTVTRGRPGRRMPAWGEIPGGLRPEEIERVISHLRSLGPPPRPDPRPSRWVAGDAAEGERLYAASCSGCHGPQGRGAEGPALNNQVLLEHATDTFMVETIARGRRGTTMEGFQQPSPVRRALSRTEIESIVSFIRSWERKGKP